ncbi:MAG: DUF4837 family protein [Bacteroidota bacterium]
MNRLSLSTEPTHLVSRQMKSFWTLVAALSLFVIAGCSGNADYRPRAVGPEGIVTVVIDSTQWNGVVGEAIRETLGGYIQTLPVPEPAFKLQPAALTSMQALEVVKKQKNVVIAAPLDDSSNTVSQFLSSRLDESVKEMIASGLPAIIPRPNLWRKDQMVVYLTAQTPDELAASIYEKSDDLLYTYNNITRERTEVEMFKKGRQANIEENLLEKHGFAVNAQHDYFVAVDTTNFVWLRRVISTETWRSLFIYFEDNANPGDLSADWVYATRDSLTKQYVQGTMNGYVEIDRRRNLRTENINFLDRYGFETRGLWHMVIEDGGQVLPAGMGGAFVTYAFYDEDSGRNYLIDGMVFAPNYPKREFLRQLEVIAHTFRSQQELDETTELAQSE